MAALTRISNNQAQSNSIHADKLQRYTLSGDIWANNLVYNSTLTVANLVVYGNSTVINSVNTTISDPIIEINSEYTGTPTLDMALLFGRGNQDNVALAWSENSQLFQLIYTPNSANSNPGTLTVDSYANLQIQNLYAGNITASSLITNGPSGNIAGANYVISNYFVGDGSLLTGMYSNVNVGAYLPTNQTIIDLQTNAAAQSANIDALWSNAAVQDQQIGNIISGNTILDKVTTTLDANIGGNVNTSNWVNTNNIDLLGALYANANAGMQGQYLTSTGVGAYWSSHFYNDATPPDTPNYGDIWYYIDQNKLFMWVTDGGSDFWYDFLPPTF